MVELAISLIVILVILAGIVDISRTIMTKMQLQDAAEEGVVYAMAFPKNCTQIQYRVLQNLSKVKSATLSSIVVTYTNIGTGVSTACASATGDLKGQLIKVSIANSFPVSMPFLGKVVGSTRTINVEAKGIVIKSN
jgi:Flp pilus assembly protein TadG